jgi:uncharacterized protein (TIRG00374 family)
MNPFVVLFAIILSFTNYVFRFFKWHIFTKSLKLDIPVTRNFQIFIAGLSLSITPAKVGEAIRAFLLKKSISSDLSKGLASTFSERLIDLLAVTFLALGGILVIGTQQSISYMPILVLILFGILFSVLVFVFDPLYSIFSYFFHIKLWSGVGIRLDKFRGDVDITFHYKAFLSALCLGILGWACEGLGFFLLAQNLGISIGIEAAIFIYATSSLLGALSFLPGGLGAVEVSMELFLANLLIISAPLAGALIIVTRMTTLWFGVALGVVVLLIVTKNIEKRTQLSE